MNSTVATHLLSALAHNGRLSLMRRLIKTGPEGMASGELANAQNIGATTASAQLLVLLNAGLVRSTQKGRKKIYHAQYSQFQKLLNFLIEDCCIDETMKTDTHKTANP